MSRFRQTIAVLVLGLVLCSGMTTGWWAKSQPAAHQAQIKTRSDRSANSASVASDKMAASDKTGEKLVVQPVAVSPIDLVRQPDSYLNKVVSFQATFNSFAGLGLDYKPAFRDSKDYVSVLVLRPDVKSSYRIPLSELKLFYPRKKSDAVLHLDAGDTVQISGKVFSTALGEPWLDINDLTIIQKAKKTETAATTKSAEMP